MFCLFLYLRWNNHKGADNICKQLGFIGGARYTAGGGTGPINAGNRLCSGGEDTVWDCPLMAATDTTACSHEYDAGVQCKGAGKARCSVKCLLFISCGATL